MLTRRKYIFKKLNRKEVKNRIHHQVHLYPLEKPQPKRYGFFSFLHFIFCIIFIFHS